MFAALGACTQHESTTAVSPRAAPAGAVTNTANPVTQSAPVIPSSPPVDRIDFRLRDADPYIKGFWRDPNPDSRWSVGHHAEVAFTLSEPGPTKLVITMGCYIVPGKIDKQRVQISLNGAPLTTLEISVGKTAVYSIPVPANQWTGGNSLVFDLPDANTPRFAGQGDDPRLLGIAIQSIEIQKGA